MGRIYNEVTKRKEEVFKVRVKVTKKEEQQFLTYFRYLPTAARREALDFMGYLLAKSETPEEATEELLMDTEMMAGIKQGLKEVSKGEVSEIEF
jgi:hypothetical protein